MNSAIVYSKPDCVQCTGTKRWLTKREIEFKEIDVTEDDSAFERITLYGYGQAPVVEILDEKRAVIDHFSGHRPSKLEEHFPK